MVAPPRPKPCPVCTANTVLLEEISAEAIARAYEDEFGIAPPQLGTIQDFELYRCPDCQLEYFAPMLTGDEAFYDWVGAHSHYAPWRWEFEPILDLAGRVGGTVVEVGAGGGTLTRELVRAGLEVVAIEPSSTAREALQDIQGATIYAHLDEFHSLGVEADIVVSCHVLEHVADPVGYLVSLTSVVRRGGHIAVSVPQYRSLMRPSGRLEAFDCPPHHVTRWTSRALSTALHIAGLTDVRIDWEALSCADAARLLSEKLTGRDRRWFRGPLHKTGVGRQVVRITHGLAPDTWRARNIVGTGVRAR